jgi:hypothetical protein
VSGRYFLNHDKPPPIVHNVSSGDICGSSYSTKLQESARVWYESAKIVENVMQTGHLAEQLYSKQDAAYLLQATQAQARKILNQIYNRRPLQTRKMPDTFSEKSLAESDSLIVKQDGSEAGGSGDFSLSDKHAPTLPRRKILACARLRSAPNSHDDDHGFWDYSPDDDDDGDSGGDWLPKASDKEDQDLQTAESILEAEIVATAACGTKIDSRPSGVITESSQSDTTSFSAKLTYRRPADKHLLSAEGDTLDLFAFELSVCPSSRIMLNKTFNPKQTL